MSSTPPPLPPVWLFSGIAQYGLEQWFTTHRKKPESGFCRRRVPASEDKQKWCLYVDYGYSR